MHLLHSFPLRKSKIQNASRNLKTIMTFYQSLPSQVASRQGTSGGMILSKPWKRCPFAWNFAPPWFLGGCGPEVHTALYILQTILKPIDLGRFHCFLRGPICHQPSRLEIAASIHCTENINQTCLVLVFHPSSCMLFSNQAPQISIPRHHSLGHVDQGSQVDGFRLSAQT